MSSALGEAESESPPADWAPPRSLATPSSLATVAISCSILVSVMTLGFFADLLAPFTSPFAIALAVVGRRRSTPGTAQRAWSSGALVLGVATLALWPFLIPVYNMMNDAM